MKILERSASALMIGWLAAAGAAGCGASATPESRGPRVVSERPAGAAVARGHAGEGDEVEVVCRRERPTGSAILRTVCRDQQEIADRRERDQQAFLDMDSRWGRFRR